MELEELIVDILRNFITMMLPDVVHSWRETAINLWCQVPDVRPLPQFSFPHNGVTVRPRNESRGRAHFLVVVQATVPHFTREAIAFVGARVPLWE